jgi:hypothetical protein
VPEAHTQKLTERDLSRWRLIEDFEKRLARAAQVRPDSLDPSWADRQRLLGFADYLSLYLFGLLNPVARTLRALCAASHLPRVQRAVCSRPVSPASFSDAQHLLDPALLAAVFGELAAEWTARDGRTGPAGQRWLIQDGSLFRALPRMHWALWRRHHGPAEQAQVRLHLTLDLASASAARAAIRPGRDCERAAWREQWRSGDAYVGDRYYGEDYQLFHELDQAGVAFVVRLRDEAVLSVDEELALSAADQAAQVVRAAWVRLGCTARYRSMRLRVVWVQTPKELLRLVTNLSAAELSAGEVALLYKERWRIELFFRWIKCVLGCRHWLAESPQGVAVQIYLALIAALLLQLYTGERPNRRLFELIQFYLLGVASLEELWAGLQRERERQARRKKS